MIGDERYLVDPLANCMGTSKARDRLKLDSDSTVRTRNLVYASPWPDTALEPARSGTDAGCTVTACSGWTATVPRRMSSVPVNDGRAGGYTTAGQSLGSDNN